MQAAVAVYVTVKQDGSVMRLAVSSMDDANLLELEQTQLLSVKCLDPLSSKAMLAARCIGMNQHASRRSYLQSW